MKFFILLCCTAAHLLSGVSAKIWRTTPMSSVKQRRLNDEEARQVSKFAEMIDFVNDVDPENNDERSFFRRRGLSKHRISRRYNEPMSAVHHFATAKDMSIEDRKVMLNKVLDPVRYHIIKNPEVLSEYKAKQKKDLQKNGDAVNVLSEAKSSGGAENELNDFPSQIESGTVLHDNSATTINPEVILSNEPTVHMRAHLDEDETSDEVAYRPSFPDEDDDDKLNTEAISVTNDKKEKIKPKIDKKDRAVLSEMTDSDEVGKKTPNSKALGKKAKAQISHKSDSIKNKHSVAKPIDRYEKLNSSVRPKDKHDDMINQKDDITKKHNEKDKKERSLDKNDRYLTAVNNDRIEQHFIYAHREKNENINKHKKHENREKYDTKKNEKHHDKTNEKHSLWIKVENKNYEKNDKKETKEINQDENHDKWSKKEKELNKRLDKWIKNNKDKVYNDGSKSEKEMNYNKFSNKENGWNRNDDRLNKKDKELDKKYDKRNKHDKDKTYNDDMRSEKEKKYNKYSNKENDWDYNEDRIKKEKDRNKMDKQRDHQDKRFDKMEYEWNKRHQEYDKNSNDAQWDNIGNEWNQNDKDFYERDNEFKTRDNEWTKRDYDRKEKLDRTNIYDKNESLNEYSDEHIDEERRVRNGRYKIVDRNSKDSSKDDDGLPLG